MITAKTGVKLFATAILVAGVILSVYKLEQESDRPCRAGEVFLPRPGARPPCYDKFTGRGFALEIRDHVAMCVCPPDTPMRFAP